ncbi:uncharacterized protein DUF1232 [Promicromonospora sp. AC04]|uniref:DUF1232 domain-containing protein n=1 Tax=Promicromonospora sp. AC04 TaxID=2135723 RepID=UPI000D385BBF|nr:DUF1232 domain-containing protein [Promicromonospora sp. AC04]PUB31839.1 uncharacterized protein DUF1232 [Promicromonospora sp. AC04]
MREENKRGKDPRKFTWQEILTFVAGAGYVASPIDLLSEGVLGPLGLGDDAVAIIIAGVTLFKAVQRFRQHRTVQGTAGDTTPGGPGSGPTTPGKTVPGTAEDVTPDHKPRR